MKNGVRKSCRLYLQQQGKILIESQSEPFRVGSKKLLKTLTDFAISEDGYSNIDSVQATGCRLSTPDLEPTQNKPLTN